MRTQPWQRRTIITNGEHMIIRLLPRIVACGNVGFTEWLLHVVGKQQRILIAPSPSWQVFLSQSSASSYFDHCEGNISCRYKFGSFLVFPCFLIQPHFFKK